MTTLQDRYATALRVRGEMEVPTRSSKYRVFTRRGTGTTRTFYFLGKAGALRCGRSVTSSIPVSETWKEQLLASLS